MGDLRGLIEAVTAGTATGGPDALAVPLDMSALIATVTGDDDELWSAFVGAHDGSLDDAKALHEALLPGWWASLRLSTRPMVTVGHLDAVAETQDDSLARAWLLAILRALEAEGKA